MELTSYADFAVRLVNSAEPGRGRDSLVTVDDARALFQGRRAADGLTASDVGRLRTVRARLRVIFEAAVGGAEETAVDELNQLLLEYPVSPRVSGHDSLTEDGRPRWHLHLAEQAGTAAGFYAASAAMGLSVHLTEHGIERLGVCGALPCQNVFLDTSTNRSRRYCSDRCATRANVAAYRARRRAAEPDRAADEEPRPRDSSLPSRELAESHDGLGQ